MLPSCFSVAFGVVFFGCAASTVVVFVLSAFPRIGALPMAAALALVGLVALGLVFRRAAAIRDGRVSAIEGVVRGYADTAGESNSYYYVLDTMRFPVQYAAYVALISGLRYRVLCTTRGKHVVSVEPIGV